jgi:hypothetical protein
VKISWFGGPFISKKAMFINFYETNIILLLISKGVCGGDDPILYPFHCIKKKCKH